MATSGAVGATAKNLALEQGVSLQGLMGEAFDDVMRKYGKHAFESGDPSLSG